MDKGNKNIYVYILIEMGLGFSNILLVRKQIIIGT